MGDSNIDSYFWRELSPDEYERFEKENMVFYHAFDVIIMLFLIGIFIVSLISVGNILSGSADSGKSKAITTLIFMLIAAIALWRGRSFVRHLGLDDIRNKNLVACDGSFVRLDERSHSRNGTTRTDYYAVVRMPDGGELAIECSLSEVEKSRPGDRITVIRPRDSLPVQRMNIMTYPY